MERLSNHFDYCKVNECKYCDEELLKQNKCQFFDVGISHCYEKRVHDKLREYEDAEEQGLLVRLPLKIGDIVYHERPFATIHTGIQAFQVTNIMISQNKKCIWYKKYRAMRLLNGKIIDSQINFSFDDIGKTVFLNQEEAEAALERMG